MDWPQRWACAAGCATHPAAWRLRFKVQLGTHLNVLIASIPEGDDKPYKYPSMYMGMQALIINKTDLLPYVPFNMDYFRQGVETLNPGLTMFQVSCKTGEGMAAWADWLVERVRMCGCR